MIEALNRSLLTRPCAWGLGLVLTFAVVPGLDLMVSGLFYRPDEGFFWRYVPFAEFVRRGLPPIAIGIAVFVLLLWMAGLAFRDRFFGVDGRIGSYLIGSLLLGPGFLANTVFKDHWGRARPSTIVEFGGAREFTPPLMIAGQCDHNCSFVSGHAALAFWGLAFALLAPVAWRRRAVVAAVGFGLVIGFVRIAQGAHFFSDVIYAGVLVAGTVLVMRRLILTRS